tara:strand:- start:49 stop:1230 length:1182 start_codon:yes stop_codon:yes gene_type:complete
MAQRLTEIQRQQIDREKMALKKAILDAISAAEAEDYRAASRIIRRAQEYGRTSYGMRELPPELVPEFRVIADIARELEAPGTRSTLAERFSNIEREAEEALLRRRREVPGASPADKFRQMPSSAQDARNVGRGAVEIDAGLDSDEQPRRREEPEVSERRSRVSPLEKFSRMSSATQAARNVGKGALEVDAVADILSRPVSPLMGGDPVAAAKTGDVGAVAAAPAVDTPSAPAAPADPAPPVPAAAAPAAPKKQTAPATKAARADDEDAPVQKMGVRPEPRPERRSSDKAERAAKKELGDIGEGQFADINQQTEMMMMEAAPQEDIGDTLVRQQDYAGEFAPSIEDLEQAKREPLGETAGRLAIQGFMQRNFGFRPEVTFDVEEQEPGGTGSMF